MGYFGTRCEYKIHNFPKSFKDLDLPPKQNLKTAEVAGNKQNSWLSYSLGDNAQNKLYARAKVAR